MICAMPFVLYSTVASHPDSRGVREQNSIQLRYHISHIPSASYQVSLSLTVHRIPTSTKTEHTRAPIQSAESS
ncbi:hypothetical protein K458DRAFT_18731 [Lentithecium fluviatile CBS 122367]|uniref:Uncharacterized protein n=1 Tax=Lentithecium fluviatile CBS 122367 TaxID=1168545 RepID=A0A6G1J6Q2_9PLEO|nr:hypothetical protein K458DRAFT_18731 [Lentithecium fluviatile CBS 122367]